MNCFSTSAVRFLERLQKLLRKGDIPNRGKSLEPCSHFSYPGGDVQIYGSCLSSWQQMATKALRRRAVASEYFLTALDTHRTGSQTPVSGQCGSDPWPQAKLCHSGSARATSKKEVSVKHLHRDCLLFLCIQICLLSCACSQFLLSQTHPSLMCLHMRKGCEQIFLPAFIRDSWA